MPSGEVSEQKQMVELLEKMDKGKTLAKALGAPGINRELRTKSSQRTSTPKTPLLFKRLYCT
jgi:hypothetical protein